MNKKGTMTSNIFVKIHISHLIYTNALTQYNFRLSHAPTHSKKYLIFLNTRLPFLNFLQLASDQPRCLVVRVSDY